MTLVNSDMTTVRNSTNYSNCKLQQLPQSAVEGTFLILVCGTYDFYCHSLKPLFFILLGKPLSFIPEERSAEGLPGV